MLLLNQQEKEDFMKIFEHLHSHPEVSWQEFETTKFVKEKLESFGYTTKVFPDCTGVIAEIGTGSPVVGLRADLDALWQEVKGREQANHSCGHDGHMTMGLGAAYLISKLKNEERPKGTIRFIFQPAEEKGEGALKMVEKGIIDDLDYLYGVHLRPIQETENGHAAPAILHGASLSIGGVINGEDAHGARPHLGKNAIEVAATLVHELAHIHVDPMVPHSVKMTMLHAGGESSNIIPGHAYFSLDMRAQTNEVMRILIEEVKLTAESIGELYRVEVKLDIPMNLAAAKLNPEAAGLMAESIADVLGPDKLDEPLLTTGGEDFHFYAFKKPSLKSTMLGLGCGLNPGLHHPAMTFDRKALFSGIHILTDVVLKTLQKGATS